MNALKAGQAERILTGIGAYLARQPGRMLIVHRQEDGRIVATLAKGIQASGTSLADALAQVGTAANFEEGAL